MPRRIVLIQGHPDSSERHLCHALADAYAEGAYQGGHEVRRVAVAELDFPLLRSAKAWKGADVMPDIQNAQNEVAWADHLVILYPLWLGTMPAILKAFMEQLFRPGFAFSREESSGAMGRKLLTRKSARIIVTMGMPAFFYRWFFRAHSLKSLERNILKFVGIRPVRTTLFGLVEGVSAAQRERWLGRARTLGKQGL
ncbi:NAD(P)H-dependent oxidoreductase [Thioalkalivibrio sp.]|uniref:NAD(P)H-dependent oxidoreductase n=1 Tax=Thioalkalivibrio sp. TaxID=2093813 RepID=UPI0039762D03